MDWLQDGTGYTMVRCGCRVALTPLLRDDRGHHKLFSARGRRRIEAVTFLAGTPILRKGTHTMRYPAVDQSISFAGCETFDGHLIHCFHYQQIRDSESQFTRRINWNKRNGDVRLLIFFAVVRFLMISRQ